MCVQSHPIYIGTTHNVQCLPNISLPKMTDLKVKEHHASGPKKHHLGKLKVKEHHASDLPKAKMTDLKVKEHHASDLPKAKTNNVQCHPKMKMNNVGQLCILDKDLGLKPFQKVGTCHPKMKNHNVKNLLMSGYSSTL